jgi:DNA polymerase III subunit epsilon
LPAEHVSDRVALNVSPSQVELHVKCRNRRLSQRMKGILRWGELSEAWDDGPGAPSVVSNVKGRDELVPSLTVGGRSDHAPFPVEGTSGHEGWPRIQRDKPMPTSQLPGPIAVIDVETTGLFPFRHDRVIEIAAVVVDDDGRIVRQFVSLLNPGRDIGPSSIHGLTSEDILHAPQFGEIAGLLVDTLQGTIAVAGHNVRFDHQFIESEFTRLDAPVLNSFTLCTMQLAGGGRLSDCCSDYEVPLNGEAHHALADALAAARLLTKLLQDQPRITQQLFGLTPIEWPTIRSNGKQPVTRAESRRRQAEPRTYLQRLVGRMHGGDGSMAEDGAVMAYAALFDRILEDRHVDDSEADALVEMAERWGLSGEQITLAHRAYLDQLAVAAMADGVVTEAERRDLQLVARLLGQENRELEQILREAAAKTPSTPTGSTSSATSDASLSGKRVCFTGELQCRRDGQLIQRELAEQLAAKAGLIIADSVTKKLDLLVLADPHSQSGKAKKARQYGVRIMHEPVFWKAVGVGVE